MMSRNAQAGNVLFLVMVAVALFAALSYAITRSLQLQENGQMAAQVGSPVPPMQYASIIQTALMRMSLENGIDFNPDFTPPENLGENNGLMSSRVFASQGGNVAYRVAPEDILMPDSDTRYIFSDMYRARDEDGPADILMFLPNLTDRACKRLNYIHLLSLRNCETTKDGIPDLDENIELDLSSGETPREGAFSTADLRAQGSETCRPFAEHQSGCFYNASTNQNIFYSIVFDR